MTYTREQILSKEAGRELDALVEQHVFGKQVEWIQDDITDPYPIVPAEYGYIVEYYSTDIATTSELDVALCRDNSTKFKYIYALCDIVGIHNYTHIDTDDLAAIAFATPEQRCKAALLAVMEL